MPNSFIALVYTHDFGDGYTGKIWQRHVAGYSYEVELLWKDGYHRQYVLVDFDTAKQILMNIHHNNTNDDIAATYVLAA